MMRLAGWRCQGQVPIRSTMINLLICARPTVWSYTYGNFPKEMWLVYHNVGRLKFISRQLFYYCLSTTLTRDLDGHIMHCSKCSSIWPDWPIASATVCLRTTRVRKTKHDLSIHQKRAQPVGQTKLKSNNSGAETSP
jgi:hypothetical protein